MEKSIELARQPETIYIKPSTGLTALNLRDLWIYRELVYFMIWRDIKVRYKQTVLGAAWAIIQPVLNNASRSLTTNVSMVTKIYFPRLVLPLASVLGNLVDFAIAFLILIVMMIYYKVTPTAAIWTLPLFIILSIVAALGVSLWLAAINVQYRDVNYVLPFLTQFWMFITPVAYSSKVISPNRTRFATAGFGGRYSACFGYRLILLPLYGADVCGHDLTSSTPRLNGGGL